MALDRRVRLLGRVLDHTVRPIAGMGPAKRRRLRRRLPEQVVALVRSRRAPGVRTWATSVPGPGGPVPVRVYEPPGPPPGSGRPVVVFFHGGGWVLGNLDTADWLCSSVARRLPAVVVSADYRLAPEHPAPAARLDALAATRWAAEHLAELGGSPDQLVVMGESAGGNLAASTALALRDGDAAGEAGGPRLAAQVLLYPATDLTLSASSLLDRPDGALLTTADVRAYAAAYLGQSPGAGGPPADPRDPLLSPLLAPDLRRLPPAVVVAAEHDPILDDARRYAARLREAGVPVTYLEYADAPHWLLLGPRACRSSGRALADLLAALRQVLGL